MESQHTTTKPNSEHRTTRLQQLTASSQAAQQRHVELRQLIKRVNTRRVFEAGPDRIDHNRAA
ncbi:MAG: hypothetical protein IT462_06425 [Planctomycetes bacterium]|nr:hypothetical protein [Planctomycetota bacterium]